MPLSLCRCCGITNSAAPPPFPIIDQRDGALPIVELPEVEFEKKSPPLSNPSSNVVRPRMEVSGIELVRWPKFQTPNPAHFQINERTGDLETDHSIFHFSFSLFHFPFSIFPFSFSLFHFPFFIFHFSFFIFNLTRSICRNNSKSATHLSFVCPIFSSCKYSRKWHQSWHPLLRRCCPTIVLLVCSALPAIRNGQAL